MATVQHRFAPSFSVSRTAGIAFLLTAKGMDVATTASMLLARPGAEANPVARAVAAHVGVLGLVFVGLAVCLTVIAVTELAADRLDDLLGGPLVVRLLGYGPLALLWTFVAIHNVRVISGALA